MDLHKDQGQGGAQAIEDGIALGIALSNLPSNEPDVIERRLGLFGKIRINRASVMQIFSNAGQDDAEKIREDAGKFIHADTVPSTYIPPLIPNISMLLVSYLIYSISRYCKLVRTNLSTESPEEFFRFNFGYDVVKDSEQIMQKDNSEWKLPESFVTTKTLDTEAKKIEVKVSVRSIVAGIESIKV